MNNIVKLCILILINANLLSASIIKYKQSINFNNVYFNNDKSIYTYAIIDNSRNQPKLLRNIRTQIMDNLVNETKKEIKIPKNKLIDLIKKENNYVNMWHKEFRNKTKYYHLYLVKVTKNSKVLKYLLNHREKDMVVYFQSAFNLKQLQKYYSSFTMPLINQTKEKTRFALFGFFDPFVFDSLTKTLYNKEKASEFFSPSLLWIIPLQYDLQVYYLDDKNIIQNTILKKQNKKSIKLDMYYDKDTILKYKDIRKIDFKQMELFTKEQLNIYVDSLIFEYTDSKYKFVNKYSNKILKEKIHKFIDISEKYKIISEGGMFRFIIIQFYYEDLGENQAFIKKLSLQKREVKWFLLDNELKRLKKENNE